MVFPLTNQETLTSLNLLNSSTGRYLAPAFSRPWGSCSVLSIWRHAPTDHTRRCFYMQTWWSCSNQSCLQLQCWTRKNTWGISSPWLLGGVLGLEQHQWRQQNRRPRSCLRPPGFLKWFWQTEIGNLPPQSCWNMAEQGSCLNGTSLVYLGLSWECTRRDWPCSRD